jgi:hypothetical protein
MSGLLYNNIYDNKIKKQKIVQVSGIFLYLYIYIYISAVAGVSSPNCGDKVEVQLLFTAFLFFFIYMLSYSRQNMSIWDYKIEQINMHKK